MQAGLILFALKILAAQLQNLPIIPPQETANGEVEQPSDHDLSPVGIAKDVEGRDLHLPVAAHSHRCNLLGQIDGHQDGEANEGQDEEHVATHGREAEEDGGVHAHMPYQLRLARSPQRRDPCPRRLSYRRRGVLLVGVLELWRVHPLIVRPEEGEADSNEGCEAKRGGQSGVNGRGS